MSTRVRVNTSVYTVTFVTDQLLRTVKEIIKLVGLDPSNMSWSSTENAVKTWLTSRHLRTITLEIYNPVSDKLVTRWDLAIDYNHSTDSEEKFWNDLEAVKFAIAKAGIVPSTCSYRIVIDNAPGRPDVAGWSSTSYRSTVGLVKQNLGTTIGTSSLGAETSYWRAQ
jgi:hypothetical protein